MKLYLTVFISRSNYEVMISWRLSHTLSWVKRDEEYDGRNAADKVRFLEHMTTNETTMLIFGSL